MLRLAPPRMERFFQSPELMATFGGGEANVAVAVAGFGLPARYVTVLPAKHPAADACIRELRGPGRGHLTHRARRRAHGRLLRRIGSEPEAFGGDLRSRRFGDCAGQARLHRLGKGV